VATHPYRVRLWGGRNVHAARDVNGGPNRVTACDHYLHAEAENHWLDADTPVACRRCERAVKPG
jgi:hypothetical protein